MEQGTPRATHNQFCRFLSYRLWKSCEISAVLFPILCTSASVSSKRFVVLKIREGETSGVEILDLDGENCFTR